MWQVLLAAAIAGGSGYLANKYILHKTDYESTNHFPVENADAETSIFDQETPSVFRFSSVSNESTDSPKKPGLGKGKKKFGVCLKKRRSGRNAYAKCDLVDHKVDDQMKSGKKLVFRLNKRRFGRKVSAKCDSSEVKGRFPEFFRGHAFKNKSSFGYGVGVGMMYMMSAGKAKINRLNIAVDETAKVVQELKAEISKRKSSSDFERIANHKRVDMKSSQSSFENDITEVYGFTTSDEGEYASTILTDEPPRDVVEMDQLEAELESELLKLQVSTVETSSSFENKSSTENVSQTHDLCNGVMPFELDQKLSQLLIEQQENQIVNLESELQVTNSKLEEKVSELQALKDCIKRLTDFFLTCPSDEEQERGFNEGNNKMINRNGRSIVGIKRGIELD